MAATPSARPKINVPLSQGLITEAYIAGSIGEIITGKKAGRTSDDEITIFDSTGIALQDSATVPLEYQRAMAAGVGVWKERFPYLAERASERAADERRWRDASPVVKLNIQIAAQKMLGMMKMAGVADPASMRRDAERVLALQAERVKLTATGE